MSKGRWAFSQRDLTRAIRAARAAGLTGDALRITPEGAIVISLNAEGEDTGNSWDEALGLCHGKRTGRTFGRSTGT